MRKPFLLLGIGVLMSTAPACDLLTAYGNLWGQQADPCAAGMGGDGAGGDIGAGGDGAGGDTGAGGDPSAGDGTDVAAGTGSGAGGSDTSSGADVAAGAGAGPGDARKPPRIHRRRPRYRYGTAYQADCPAPPEPIVPPPPQPVMAPKPPNLVPFNTWDLKRVAIAQNIGAGKTGIQFNRDVGLAFEKWVLVTMNQIPRWTKPIPSQLRANQNPGGLPGAVIPEFVASLSLWWSGEGVQSFDNSMFFEVKAVTAPLTLGTSRFQILGLIDVASRSSAGMSTAPKHPPPMLVFTTTANTAISSDVLQQATQVGVAIWQQTVWMDLDTDPNNPDLYIQNLDALNREVYPTANVYPSPGTWKHSPLTSPMVPDSAVLVPNDPDPPELD